MASQDTVIQVKEYLEAHVGRAKAVRAARISRDLKIKDGATWVNTRTAITQAIESFDMPVVNDQSAGYFFAETREELDGQIRALNSRIAKMEERKARIIRNFENAQRANRDKGRGAR